MVAHTAEIQYIYAHFPVEWDAKWIQIGCAPGKGVKKYLLQKLCEHLWDEYEDKITSWYEDERDGEIPSPDDKTFLYVTIVKSSRVDIVSQGVISMPLIVVPLEAHPKIMTAMLRSSEGQTFTWAAIGRWEQVRCLREKALEFCWENNLEDSYRFRYDWLEGSATDVRIPWDDLDDVEIDDDELWPIIKQVLDHDEREETMHDHQKSAFYAVLSHYDYIWNEDVYSPVNHEYKTTSTWIIKSKY